MQISWRQLFAMETFACWRIIISAAEFALSSAPTAHSRLPQTPAISVFGEVTNSAYVGGEQLPTSPFVWQTSNAENDLTLERIFLKLFLCEVLKEEFCFGAFLFRKRMMSWKREEGNRYGIFQTRMHFPSIIHWAFLVWWRLIWAKLCWRQLARNQ